MGTPWRPRRSWPTPAPRAAERLCSACSTPRAPGDFALALAGLTRGRRRQARRFDYSRSYRAPPHHNPRSALRRALTEGQARMTKARAKAPVEPPAPVPVELPAPAPVIDGILPADTVVQLVGTPGSGRSTVCCEWAAAVATGTDWNGHHAERRRVVYLDASKEQRDIADTIEAVAGREVPTEWLRVLPGRVALAGDDLGGWLDTIRAYAPGLVVLDELGVLGAPCGGIDHHSWADAVSAFAQRLFDVTASGGSVVVAHECDARGTIAGAPLGDGVDLVLRLGRVGGRIAVRAMGPARSGRRRATEPTRAPALAPMPERGGWAGGQWVGGYSPV